MKDNRSKIGSLYEKYASRAKKSTPYLSRSDKYGYKCEIFFPLYNKPVNEDYSEVDIYATHENANYSSKPDAIIDFYIVGLIKNQFMNSPSSEFETFYLEGDDDRAYIETIKENELPIQTKVIVHFSEETKMIMWIEKKTMNQASILRMYLNVLV